MSIRKTMTAVTSLWLAAGLIAAQPTQLAPGEREASAFFDVLRIERFDLTESMPLPAGAGFAEQDKIVVLWGKVPGVFPYLPRAMASDQIVLEDAGTLFVRHPLAGRNIPDRPVQPHH